MQSVVLSSGGVDSFLTWALLSNARTAKSVFVDVGQKYVERERAALNRLTRVVPDFRYVEVKGPPLGEHETPSGIIPNRNAEMVLAASFHGEDILLGVLRDEINSDKSAEFMSAIQTVLNISWRGQYWNGGVAREFRVRTLIGQWTKTELIGRALKAGVPALVIRSTLSCYASDSKGFSVDEHCGACPSCFKRWVAFANNGIGDADDFKSDPLMWANDQGIIRKAIDGTYRPDRASEIMTAVARVWPDRFPLAPNVPVV